MITLVAIGNVGNVKLDSVGNESVLNFRLAVSNKKTEVTTWFSCAFWGKRAAAITPYIEKGSKVCVAGILTTREFDGKLQLDLRVNDIELCGSKQQDDRGF